MQGRGILTALRAAAVVIIATGLNDVLAGALPRYEPLYLYLAAVALVALLDGLLLGALTAVVATSFYALLFMPRPAALSKAVLVPLGVAFAAVIAGSIVRGIVRGRTRRVAVAERLAPPTPLLMPPIVIDHGEVLTAIDELRGELRSALSDVSHDEARVAEATARIAELERTLADERITREADAARLAELERAIASERAAREAGVARLTELDGALQETRAEAVARADERDAAREEAHAQAARLSELDAALRDARTEASLRSEELAAIRAAAEELRRTINIERGRADGERGLRTTAVERVTELERALNVREADAARLQERIAELQQHAAEERSLRERLELDAQSHDATLAMLRGRLHGLEQMLESTRVRAADQERLLRMRIEELEESLVSDLESRDAKVAAERARAEEAERTLAARDAAVATLSIRLEELTRAAEERDQARADAEAQAARVAELERSESDALARVVSLESEVASERASFDQKLNTIMVHLAQDHEADLGKAVEEREEAKAEARSLTMRVGVQQKKLDDQRHALDDAARLLAETRAAAQQEIDRLRARVAEFEKPVVRPRILIAHPDAELRANARASLERAGYEIVSAADGLEALRTAIAQRPAVVIADAVMPKMDGRELCQLLKSQEKTAHIRVILLTRSTDAPPKGDLMPDEVLRKPVPLETLKTTLAALLA